MNTLTLFEGKGLTVKEGAKLDTVKGLLKKSKVVWLDCVDISKDELYKMRDIFGIDQMIIDSCTSEERPEIGNYGDIVYMVFKTMRLVEGPVPKQINFIIKGNLVITIRPASATFDKLRLNIENYKDKIITYGVGYLLGTIMDAIVDGYYYAVYEMEERIEKIEEDVLGKPSKEVINKLFALKKNLILMRKILWPEADVVKILEYRGILGSDRKVQELFGDVNDHLLYVHDMLQTQMGILSSINETYYASVSNEMSYVMKILTIFTGAAIIPQVIGALFGMNLPGIPPLNFMYVSFLAIALTIFAVLLFKIVKWI